jgi:hypothetical protein
MAVQLHRNNTVDISTIGDNGFVAVEQETTIEMGIPRESGKLVFVRTTYPAIYNHVVRNMNSINHQTNTKNKRSMRGGHFFLYRYVVLLAMLLCFSFGIASIYAKGCSAVPFILTVLYIALSIYNIVIFIINRPLLNPILTKQVPRQLLGDRMNRFYTIPVNATVLTGAVAGFIDPAVIAAAVRRDNIELTKIQIMLYDDIYRSRRLFPVEIIVHLIIFLILFILAIIFVSIRPSS